MIIVIFCYILTSSLALFCCSKLRERTQSLPVPKVKPDGLHFCSKSRHRLRVGRVSVVRFGHQVMLKRGTQSVILHNIDKVFYQGNYIYFTALGACHISIDCSGIYRYFSVKIQSSQFDLTEAKQNAQLDLFDHLFSPESSPKVQHYIHILRDELCITLTDQRLSVRRNKYLVPFTLIYRLNHRTHHLNVR